MSFLDQKPREIPEDLRIRPPTRSRILGEFLKAHKGKYVFCGITPTPGGNKAGSVGFLEDYDDDYVYLRGEEGLMVMAIKSIISFEMSYEDLKHVEIIA
jgi:hypothetical protein